MKYLVIIERAADGSYSAYVPDLPGCTSSGESVLEVRENVGEAIAGHVALLREMGEPVPEPSSTAETVEAAA